MALTALALSIGSLILPASRAPRPVPMAIDDTARASDKLQFDRAVTARPTDAAPAAGAQCTSCKRSITTAYYHAAGKTICGNCRGTLEQLIATPRDWRSFGKAALFGIGAAIAGAIIYYGVIAITNFEIGIVAILIGYMVGYMVRKGAAGKGGRRFQVLAAVLTYWSVGLAYAPITFKALEHKSSRTAASADSTTARDTTSADSAKVSADSAMAPETTQRVAQRTAAKRKPSGRDFVIALGAVFLMTFALPIVFVLGTLPAGLISAFIIFLGIRHAWRVTAAPSIPITGPYKVAAAGPAPSV